MATAPIKKRRSLIFRACRASIVLVLLMLALIYFVFVLPFWGSPFNNRARVACRSPRRGRLNVGSGKTTATMPPR